MLKSTKVDVILVVLGFGTGIQVLGLIGTARKFEDYMRKSYTNSIAVKLQSINYPKRETSGAISNGENDFPVGRN